MLLIQNEELTSPCVYIFKKDQVPTYIGVGTKGMKRIFDFGFNDGSKPRTTAIAECDVVEVFFFQSEKEARENEGRLIHESHPEHNRFCLHCDFYYRKHPRQFRKQGQLFGLYKSAILSLLLGNPERAYHIREIAAILNLSVGSARRELTGLAKYGIIRRLPKAGNRVYYQAEESHPIYPELRSLVAKGA
jgi:hypothetical protein